MAKTKKERKEESNEIKQFLDNYIVNKAKYKTFLESAQNIFIDYMTSKLFDEPICPKCSSDDFDRVSNTHYKCYDCNKLYTVEYVKKSYREIAWQKYMWSQLENMGRMPDDETFGETRYYAVCSHCKHLQFISLKDLVGEKKAKELRKEK